MSHNITDISLQKAATDSGCEIPADTKTCTGWSLHRSCRFSLSIWLRIASQGAVVVVSKSDVLDKLLQENPHLITTTDIELPPNADGAFIADNYDMLHAMLARIVQLELSLPHRLAESFTIDTKDLPIKTETERLVIQRIGQNKLRAGLLEYWNDTCAVSGLTLKEVLRASHIKPWSKCIDANERLNIYNALLLAPHLDVLFNDGFISFNDDGVIILSPCLTSTHCDKLSLDKQFKISCVNEAHLPFLHYHRQHIFKS